jgi:hypothetical protein
MSSEATVDIRDGVCAYLTGGLGNQLFVLVAAWQQATRLQCPLYIDSSKFLGGDLRAYELSLLDLPGVEIQAGSPWANSGPTGGGRRDRLRRKPRDLEIFVESGFGYDKRIENIRPGSTIVGYFQSPKYFDQIAPEVARMLINASRTPGEDRLINQFESDPRITMHVRRGDYLDAATQIHHGVATVNYFTRAFRLFEALGHGEKYRVFSDSVEVVKHEFKDSLLALEFHENADELSTIATLQAMAAGTSFVMSNSSFSWWAAWMMRHSQPHATIVAPRPWLASGESAADLLLADWLTLDAR